MVSGTAAPAFDLLQHRRQLVPEAGAQLHDALERETVLGRQRGAGLTDHTLGARE
ncbi:hypothetical protein SMICM304S_01074 [Streptomyces microflavus]